MGKFFIYTHSFVRICVITALLVLTYSLSIGFLFVVVLFFYLNKCSELGKGFFTIEILISVFLCCVLVIVNKFFLSNLRLLIVIILYCSFVLSAQILFILFVFKKKYGIVHVFVFSVVWNLILELLPYIFPLFFTLGIYNLDFVNFITTNLLPVFTEGLIISAVCLIFKLVKREYVSLNIVLFVIIITVSLIISALVKPKKKSNSENNSVISVALIHSGYTLEDYLYMEKYVDFAEKEITRQKALLYDLKDVDLVIFPESSFIISNNQSENIRDFLLESATEKSYGIVADLHLRSENEEEKNIMFLFNSDGVEQRYEKRSLVPFVETSKLSAGGSVNLFEFKDRKILPMVCYDSVFCKNYGSTDEYDFVLVISNDAFADGTVLNLIHSSMSKMYAKLFNKPMLYVSQSSGSFFINEEGFVTDISQRYERGISITEVKLPL